MERGPGDQRGRPVRRLPLAGRQPGAGITNGSSDIFVHDRQTGTIERVSVASDGTEGNADSLFPDISGDGRLVAFSSAADNLVPGDTNGISDTFVHDRQTGVTTRVSVASDGSQAQRDHRRDSWSTHRWGGEDQQ